MTDTREKIARAIAAIPRSKYQDWGGESYNLGLEAAEDAVRKFSPFTSFDVTEEEVVSWLHERNEWRSRISEALGMTVEDYGVREATLDEAVQRIEELRKQK